MKLEDIKIDDAKATEDMLINIIETFANAFDKMKECGMEVAYGKENLPTHFIKCTTTEVREVYILVKTEKPSKEIYELVDGCNSEEDMMDVLNKNDICYVDREEEYWERKNEFNVDEVEECR